MGSTPYLFTHVCTGVQTSAFSNCFFVLDIRVLQGSAAWVIFRRPQLNLESVQAAEAPCGIIVGNSSGEWEWAEENEPEESARANPDHNQILAREAEEAVRALDGGESGEGKGKGKDVDAGQQRVEADHPERYRQWNS